MDKPPKIRDDLIIRENIKEDGSRYFVIKDPLTNTYFKVGEPEYFIISHFDGQMAISEIRERFREKFREEIDEESITGFAAELQRLCFLDNDLTRRELLQKQRLVSQEKETLLRRILFIKMKAFNPGKLFDRLMKFCGFFFTKSFVWIATILMLVAFYLTLSNGSEIVSGIASLWSIRGVIIFYFSMFLVVVFHEFAHGLTCTYFGGKVNDIGFILLYFQPTFYCNVSDAWLFPERSKRLWVSFSGAFFQLFIWALATMLWRVTAIDTFINEIALGVISFSGIATLFNFNPLLRYDGYYLLSDYLEIPNLRKKAGKYWRNLWRKIFLSSKTEFENYALREKRIYFYYGLLSFIYIVLVLGYLFFLLAKFLVSRLGGTGFLIFAAIMIFLFRNIIMDAVNGTKEFVTDRKGLFRRWSTWVVIAIIIIAIVLIFSFVGWELRVKGELVVNPLHSLILKYNSGGYAELLQYDSDNQGLGQQRQVSSFSSDYTTTRLLPMVRQGDTVVAGQVIARLVNNETSQLIREYTARLAEANEQLELLKQGPRTQEIDQARNNMNEMDAELKLSIQNLERITAMYQKSLIAKQAWEDAQADSVIKDSRFKAARSKLWMLKSGSRPEEIKGKEAEIERLKSQIDFHSRQQESYEIKSTINGIILKLDTGEVVCEIADLDTMEARIVISEKEMADIAIGQNLKFKARGYPDLTFYGTVYRIDNQIMVDANGHRVVNLFCKVPNENHLLRPGMTGVANVYCGYRKINYHIYRKFFRTIRTEFWDWFDWL
jgi:putative peptide zinc metalloprotease protein